MRNAFSGKGEEDAGAAATSISKRGVRLWICLGVIAVVGVAIAQWRNGAERQRVVVDHVQRAGGHVLYDFEMRPEGSPTDEGLARIDAQNGNAAGSPRLTALDRFLIRSFGIDAIKGLHTVGARIVELEPSAIALLADIPTLRSAALGGSGVTDSAMAKLARNKALERLVLRHTRVSDSGLKAFWGHRGLWELSVTLCDDVTDSSISAISSLKLRSLGIAGTRITPQGLRQFPPSDHLFRMSCSAGQLDSETLQHLARFPRLSNLTIDVRNPLEMPDLAEFRRLRPDVTIQLFDLAKEVQKEEAWRQMRKARMKSIATEPNTALPSR